MTEDIKPRTIPDALGLTDRKYKTIYETVNESMAGKPPIEALVDIKSMFTDPSELTFAIYAFSLKVGYAKAKKEQEAEEQKAFVAGQVVAVSKFQELLNELADRGVITINDPRAANMGNRNFGSKPKSDSNVPDDVLYGGDYNPGSSRQQPTPSIPKQDTVPSDHVNKPKNDDDNKDIMYG